MRITVLTFRTSWRCKSYTTPRALEYLYLFHEVIFLKHSTIPHGLFTDRAKGRGSLATCLLIIQSTGATRYGFRD